jgi:hypothetical protein
MSQFATKVITKKFHAMLKVLLSLSCPSLTMTSEVDTLGELTEKLKRLIDDIQNQYESFIDSNQLYKQRKVNEKAFFGSIGDYMVAMSALNFLAIRVILEMKSTMDKRVSIKNTSGEMASPSTDTDRASNDTDPLQNTGSSVHVGEEYTMPKPQQPQQQEPTFKPIDIEVRRSSVYNKETTIKSCIVCGSIIPKQAKFCSKCGNSQ